MDDGTIRSQLRSDLADVPLARGVNNHEGSRATADARVMNDVAAVLNKDERIEWYVVESENFESIHNHSAYAYIESK
jgi:polysaccharide deacetylase 2 family uncharacterized protein YibQ